MNFNLRGRIVPTHPYQLDKTLTVEGTAAESKATGERINAVQKVAEEHVAAKANPHNVTKEQIGLGNVDNTPDNEKPVSVLQAEAIAEAKKAGTDAQTAAESAQEVANNAQVAAENAHEAANNAQTAADEAKNLAESKSQEAEQNAKRYTDSKHNIFTVTLTAEGWTGEAAPFTQSVDVEGILETDRPHWGLIYSDIEEGVETTVHELKLAEKEAYNVVDDLDTANGSVTFTCLEEKPAIALTIQMEVNR